MSRLRLTLVITGALAASAACTDVAPFSQTQMSEEAASWWQWHGEQQEIEMAVGNAINEPGGGDYAEAVEIIRRSAQPPAVKRFQVGQLIVEGRLRGSRKPAAETMEQGVRMMEDATLVSGPRDESDVQTLRLLFAQGGPEPSTNFPTDPEVAACWLAIEQKRAADPARCIALRRRKLPHVDA